MMGRLDLSVGATASMANIVLCAAFGDKMENLPLALVLTLGAGTLVGIANGVMSTKLRIPAFLATLASSMIVSGLVVFFTGGSPRGATPTAFRAITEAWLFGIVPYSALIWLTLMVALTILIHFTMLGRKMILSAPTWWPRAIAASPRTRSSFRHLSFAACLRRSPACCSRRSPAWRA